LASIGPAPDKPLKPGIPWYNDPSSAIGAPAFNLPVLEVDELPLGVQLLGFHGCDGELTAIARWILHAMGSPVVGINTEAR